MAPTLPLKPGILIVTLHEGKGFKLPPHLEEKWQPSHHAGSLSTGGGFSVAGSMRPTSSSRDAGLAGSYVRSGGGRPQSSAGAINAAPTVHGRYNSRHLPYALIDFDKQQVFINAVSGSPENPLWAGESTQYKFDVSRPTDIIISLYIRNPNAPPNSARTDDAFIGTLRVNPRFEEVSTATPEADPKLSKKDKEKAALAAKEQEKEPGQVGTQWIDVQFGA